MTTWRFAAFLLAIVLLSAALRAIYPLADPPWHASVGIVWHDEGAWTHNARNRALFGVWRLDEWNPMYLTPVFTGLEYLSFRQFHVGLWQARLVSQAAGVASVLLLGLGVARVAGREAGLLAAALLATNYVYVMWDRAALMEATMVAFMVVSWFAYARAADAPAWGVAAGCAAVLSFFTKAAAAFFVLALTMNAILELLPSTSSVVGDADRTRRAAIFTLIGLALAALAALAVFIVPYWSEFRFYNWQMSVTRKPSYTPKAFLDRLSWLPIVHDFFTRMWLATIVAIAAALGVLIRWRRTAAAERLLLLWLGFGIAELVLHDVGNERRLIFLIPAGLALAAIVLARDRCLLPREAGALPLRRALFAAPLVLFALYIITGALVRLGFLYQVRPGVRSAAAFALLLGGAVYATWPRIARALSSHEWSFGQAAALVGLIMIGDLAQFVQWSSGRTYKNYDAMVTVGRWLAPGTLVHGKLANGLDLENRIKPVFVGRAFGNYSDRTIRDDVRYLLTYIDPRIGYEGLVITDVLDAYPGWKILGTFEVAETANGNDCAALIDKMPQGGRRTASGDRRAGH